MKCLIEKITKINSSFYFLHHLYNICKCLLIECLIGWISNQLVLYLCKSKLLWNFRIRVLNQIGHHYIYVYINDAFFLLVYKPYFMLHDSRVCFFLFCIPLCLWLPLRSKCFHAIFIDWFSHVFLFLRVYIWFKKNLFLLYRKVFR